MSKKSEQFWNYNQPDFYHFSEDSIFLVNQVLEFIENKEIKNCADFCSGCGIIAIELILKKNNLIFDIVEIQEDFKECIKLNLEKSNTLKNINEVFIGDLFKLKLKRYDLIVCNPPYFLPSDSRLSKIGKRNICRIASKDDFLEELIRFTIEHLSSKGNAFFVLKLLKTLKLIEDFCNKEKIGFSILAKKNEVFILRIFHLNINID